MREITAQQLKAKLEAGERLDVVDIRETPEFEDWHIDGSRNVPVYEALKEDDHALDPFLATLPHDRPLVTVCRAGVLSRKAAALLESKGFQVSSLNGGIRAFGAVSTEARVRLASDPAAVLVQLRRNGKGCLSYVLGSEGEAVVVDPSADVSAYLALAERERLRITRVLETHVHADHLSRAREVCRRTGAALHLPPNRRVQFAYEAVPDGARMRVGALEIEALATPGHTGESTCYLVNGEALLSGDTLFVERVGRPDLERGDGGAAAGAKQLFSSLSRLSALGSDVQVLPAHHGAPIGFAGIPITARLGELRLGPGWLEAGERAFVERILSSLGAKPPSFDRVIAINEGRMALAEDPLDLESGPNRCAAG